MKTVERWICNILYIIHVRVGLLYVHIFYFRHVGMQIVQINLSYQNWCFCDIGLRTVPYLLKTVFFFIRMKFYFKSWFKINRPTYASVCVKCIFNVILHLFKGMWNTVYLLRFNFPYYRLLICVSNGYTSFFYSTTTCVLKNATRRKCDVPILYGLTHFNQNVIVNSQY